MVSPVIIARVVFGILGVAIAIDVAYTIAIDGTPFRMDVLSPWMACTLHDFYTNVSVLLAWVWYKETAWISRILWTALFICLGSIFTCVYVVVQLFRIKASDPIWSILLRESHARLLNYDLLERD